MIFRSSNSTAINVEFVAKADAKISFIATSATFVSQWGRRTILISEIHSIKIVRFASNTWQAGLKSVSIWTVAIRCIGTVSRIWPSTNTSAHSASNRSQTIGSSFRSSTTRSRTCRCQKTCVISRLMSSATTVIKNQCAPFIFLEPSATSAIHIILDCYECLPY